MTIFEKTEFRVGFFEVYESDGSLRRVEMEAGDKTGLVVFYPKGVRKNTWWTDGEQPFVLVSIEEQPSGPLGPFGRFTHYAKCGDVHQWWWATATAEFLQIRADGGVAYATASVTGAEIESARKLLPKLNTLEAYHTVTPDKTKGGK